MLEGGLHDALYSLFGVFDEYMRDRLTWLADFDGSSKPYGFNLPAVFCTSPRRQGLSEYTRSCTHCVLGRELCCWCIIGYERNLLATSNVALRSHVARAAGPSSTFT